MGWRDAERSHRPAPITDDADKATAVKQVAPAEVFGFFRENFAVISGLAVIGGIALATVFLSSYLSVFDWHLVWFVQYTDILTFGLVALGLIGGSALLLQSIAQSFLGAAAMEGKSKRVGFVVVVLLFVALFASNLYEAIRYGRGYLHVVDSGAVIVTGLMLVLLSVRHVRSAAWPTAGQAAGLLFLAVTCAVLFGQWLGRTVLETSEFDQDIHLKNQTLTGVKLIGVMSRSTILLKDEVIHVVPTADISEFRSAGKK